MSLDLSCNVECVAVELYWYQNVKWIEYEMNVCSGIEVILMSHDHSSPFLCYGAAYAELLSYDLFSDFEAFTNILWT
jgi:hypothetical protein